MLTASLLLFGTLLLALALAEGPVRRLPLTPALIYLAAGGLAGALLGGPSPALIQQHALPLTVATEFAVLVSLVAVGLRLRVPPTLASWRVAWLLAGPGMVLTIVLAAAAGHWLLALSWPAAWLLAAILAPTDPVLASEVQIRSDADRDAVRLAISAEGGLNDGTALPAVMLGLGLLGLHSLGEHGRHWWWADLAWPIGGGLLLGVALGSLLGLALQSRLRRDQGLSWDELVYVGTVALAYGLARATGTSAFVVAFAAGATLLLPIPIGPESGDGLRARLHAFGGRCERLVEASAVMAVGVALNGVPFTLPVLLFALLLVLVLRPLSVLLVVRERSMPRRQRRLVAWFGIRGVGSLFYLAYALQHGVTDPLATTLIAATLWCVAISIVLHGVSATPLMAAYHRRQRREGRA